MEFSLQEGEFVNGFAEEGLGKGVGAERVAEETDASGNFGGVIPGVGVKKCDGMLKVVTIKGCEVW